MYKKDDVFNIAGSSYELTEMDETIFNELGYVLHQADAIHKPFGEGGRVFSVIYKENFGSILNQKLISVDHTGNMRAGMWVLDRYQEKDFIYLKLTGRERQLLKQKYDELLEGYWSNVANVM